MRLQWAYVQRVYQYLNRWTHGWRMHWEKMCGGAVRIAHLDEVARLLRARPHVVHLVAVNAEPSASVHCVVNKPICKRLTPRDSKLLLEFCLLGEWRVEILGLGERGLVCNSVVVVVNELRDASADDTSVRLHGRAWGTGSGWGIAWGLGGNGEGVRTRPCPWTCTYTGGAGMRNLVPLDDWPGEGPLLVH